MTQILLKCYFSICQVLLNLESYILFTLILDFKDFDSNFPSDTEIKYTKLLCHQKPKLEFIFDKGIVQLRQSSF